MSRWKWAVRIAVGVVLLAAAGLLLLVYFTPVPERLAEYFFRRALLRSGGRLVIAERSGSLSEGFDLTGVRLTLPDGTALEARRVHLRLGRGALLAGTVQFKDLVLDGPRLALPLSATGGPGTPGGETAVPPWLRVTAPQVRLVGGRVELLREGAEPLVFSAIDGRLDVSCFLQRVGIRVEALGFRPPSPGPAHLDVSGTVDLAPDLGGRFDLTLASPLSELRGRGSWKPERGGGPAYHARVEVAALALAELRPFWAGAPDLKVAGLTTVEGAGRSLRYEADLRSENAGAVAARGTLAFTGEAWRTDGDLRTTGLQLHPLLRAGFAQGAEVAGTASWKAHGAGGLLEAWQAEASLGPSSVRGMRIEGARLSGAGAGPQLRVSGSVESLATGPVEGSLDWRGAGRWRLEASGRRVPLDELLRATGLERELPRGLALPPGDWAVARFDLGEEDGTTSVGAVAQDPAGGRWEVDAGPIRGADVRQAAVRFSDFDPARYGLGPPGHLAGSASFSGQAFRSGTLQVALQSSEWGGLTVKPFTARLQLAEDRLELAPVEVETSAGRLSARGTFERDGGLDAAVDLLLTDLAALRGLAGRETPSGVLEASIHVGGSTSAPSLTGRAVLTRAAYAGLQAGEVRLEGRWDEAGDSSMTLSWKDARIQDQALGGGRVALKGPPDSLSLEAEGDAGHGRTVAFRASGAFGLEGCDLRLTQARIQAEGRTFQQDGEARLTWREDGVGLTGLTMVKGASRLTLSARLGLGVPFEAAPIGGALEASGLPLALLPIPRTAGTVRGQIDADLSWSGTSGAPVLHGEARLREGSYQYAGSDRVIAPITLALRADGDRLTLVNARAQAPDGGEATGSGSVRFRGFLPSEFDLSLEGRNFPFLLGTDVEGTADFTASLTGTPFRPVLEGSAKVRKGRIQLPEVERQQAIPKSVTFVNVPPDSPFQPREREESSVAGLLRGRFRLTSDGALWVSSRNLLAELAGSVIVRFTARGPTLEGGLDVLQGRFLFQGRKFELADSRISFSGTTDLVPYLAVKATYTTPDAEITVNLEGPANAPQLRLSSVPPMDQGDILSELLYGRKTQDLSTGDARSSVAPGAGAIALYGSGPALDSVRHALGLDTMEVGVGTGTQVSFSKYFGDNVVMQYQQTFGSLPEWHASLRYRLDRAWSVQTESNSKGTSGIDLFWERRY